MSTNGEGTPSDYFSLHIRAFEGGHIFHRLTHRANGMDIFWVEPTPCCTLLIVGTKFSMKTGYGHIL